MLDKVMPVSARRQCLPAYPCVAVVMAANKPTRRDHDQSGLGGAAGPSNAPPAASVLGSAGLLAAARQQQHAAREAAAPWYPEANQEVVGILLRNSDNPWPNALPLEPIACTDRQLLLFVPQWGGGVFRATAASARYNTLQQHWHLKPVQADLNQLCHLIVDGMARVSNRGAIMQVIPCRASAGGNHELCGLSRSRPNVPHCRNMFGALLGTHPMSLVVVLYICLFCAMRHSSSPIAVRPRLCVLPQGCEGCL
jgi:hypothetical protein